MVSWLETHALGNGVAGTTAATAFRERDKDSQNDRQVKSVFLVPHRAPHFVWFVRPGKWELTEVCEEGLVDRTNLLFNRYGFVAGQVRREKPTRRFVVATHTRRHILEANASLCGRDLPCFFSLNNLRSRILFYSFVQEQAMKATVEQIPQPRLPEYPHDSGFSVELNSASRRSPAALYPPCVTLSSSVNEGWADLRLSWALYGVRPDWLADDPCRLQDRWHLSLRLTANEGQLAASDGSITVNPPQPGSHRPSGMDPIKRSLPPGYFCRLKLL